MIRGKYILNMLLCLVFTPAEMHAQTVRKKILITSDIEYCRVINNKQEVVSLQLDIYQLQKQDHIKRPAIVLVHGGGFSGGDKGYAETQGNFYPNISIAFARRGYTAFSVNYRLWPNCPVDSFPIELDNAIADVLVAVKWIKDRGAEYDIDTAKIILGGDSAGGGLVVNTSYCHSHAHHFAGCIDMWGGLPPYGNQVTQHYSVNRCPIKSQTPPTCIIHGMADNVVPYFTSQCLSDSLNATGIYNELHALPGAGHYPIHLSDQIIRIMIAFSDKIIAGE